MLKFFLSFFPIASAYRFGGKNLKIIVEVIAENFENIKIQIDLMVDNFFARGDSVALLEEMFGVQNIDGLTLDERKKQVVARWLPAVYQTAEQLTAILNFAGFDCKIYENYGDIFGIGVNVCSGANARCGVMVCSKGAGNEIGSVDFSGYLAGGGNYSVVGNTINDSFDSLPVDAKDWGRVFFVASKNSANEPCDIPENRYADFKLLILKFKKQSSYAIVNLENNYGN